MWLYRALTVARPNTTLLTKILHVNRIGEVSFASLWTITVSRFQQTKWNRYSIQWNYIFSPDESQRTGFPGQVARANPVEKDTYLYAILERSNAVCIRVQRLSLSKMCMRRSERQGQRHANFSQLCRLIIQYQRAPNSLRLEQQISEFIPFNLLLLPLQWLKTGKTLFTTIYHTRDGITLQYPLTTNSTI